MNVSILAMHQRQSCYSRICWKLISKVPDCRLEDRAMLFQSLAFIKMKEIGRLISMTLVHEDSNLTITSGHRHPDSGMNDSDSM